MTCNDRNQSTNAQINTSTAQTSVLRRTTIYFQNETYTFKINSNFKTDVYVVEALWQFFEPK